jgi:hypothetical protein
MGMAPAIFCLTFPESADACIDQSTGSTVLKVLTAILVGGLFAYNHYKSRINTLVKRLLAREEKHK